MKTPQQANPVNVDFFEDLTGRISKQESAEVEAIGDRVKNLRQAKGLSLEALANLTGFNVELLSQIEGNQIQPQLGTVIKLSKALDTALGRVLSGVGDKLYSVTRKSDQKIVSRSTSGSGTQNLYTYKSLAPEVKGRHMEAMLVTLEENRDGEKSVHEGEEFIYVIEGQVHLEIASDSFDLTPGDSVYYLSTTPHLICASQGQATILAVLYGGE